MHVLVMNKVDKAGNISNDKLNRDHFVEVPRGWSRGLEKDNVVYISPSSECLRSKADVVRYLTSDETCKCGLECPLNLDRTFNFDPNVPSKHFRISQWNNTGHTAMCELAAREVNAFKQNPVNLPQADKKRDKAGDKPVKEGLKQEKTFPKSDHLSITQLPSFETFKQRSEQKPNETLKGPVQVKKSSQAKRAGANKRKSSATTHMQSASACVSEPSNQIQQCITVHATNTPIAHSYVKSTVSPNQTKEVVSSSSYPRVTVAGGTGRATEQPPLPGLAGTLLSFPSTRLNASSYLASLSSGTSSVSRCHLPYSSQAPGEMVCLPVPTAAAAPSFANKTSIDCLSFSQKPVPTGFAAASAASSSKAAYFPSGVPAKSSHTSTAPWKENVSHSMVPTLSLNKNTAAKVTLGKSKGGFSMRTACNSATSNRFSTKFKVLSGTPSFPVSCNTTPLGSSKTYSNQSDTPLTSRPSSTLAEQTTNTSSVALPVKVEPSASSSMYHATAMMAPAEKHKARISTTVAASKASDSLSQPMQYCGIIVHPTGAMAPQAPSAPSRSSSLGGLNIQGVDPSQFPSLYALQGIPYGNSIGTLGNSGVLAGMPSGAVVPYVLGIAQTGTAPKSSAATTGTTKVSLTGPTSSAGSSATSTGSAAIAAAYSAFVSIAPASVTSSSYSQQLLNMVNNYNNPYWQQILSHGTNANALAYQLMQMNQYAALRATSNQGGSSAKSSSMKQSSSGQQQTKQTSTTSTTVSVASSRASSQAASTPVALYVVNTNELSSSSATSGKTTDSVHQALIKTSPNPAASMECPVDKTLDTTGPAISETSVSKTESANECKTNPTITSVVCALSSNRTEEAIVGVLDSQGLVAARSPPREAECHDQVKDSRITTNEEGAESNPPVSPDTKNNDESFTSCYDSGAMNNKSSLGVRDQDDDNFRTCTSDASPSITKQENVENGDKNCLPSAKDSVCDEDLLSDITTREESKSSHEDCKSSSDSEKATAVCVGFEKGNELDIKATVGPIQSNDGSEEDDEGDPAGNKDVVENGETESTSNEFESRADEKKEEEEFEPMDFTIGDVVWAQARGLPSWPGKIVDERDVGSGRADNGKKWVMWFGDHTFSQVEVEKLKRLSEGLKSLDDKGRKRKYRGKKTRIGLEQAISEALEELDQRERLRSRQGNKAKKRKLRD